MHWFRTAADAADAADINDDDPIGRPNILKLANRFESYVDIENKVNAAGRSSSMSSPNVGNTNNTPAPASRDSDSCSSENNNDTRASSDYESNDGVSGIMV